MKHLMKSALIASALAFAMPQAASAQDQYPLTGAEWIEVTGISIEDGVDGIDQLERSIEFLKGKIAQHWG